MHSFLKVVGALVAMIGVLVGGAIVIHASENTTSQLTGILIGAGLALPGAILYCFGAVVEHLIEIRWTAKQQLAALERIAGGGAAAVEPSRRTR